MHFPLDSITINSNIDKNMIIPIKINDNDKLFEQWISTLIDEISTMFD